MRSLFLRIFLSFWLAMGLILACTVLVSATLIVRSMDALQKLDPVELSVAAERRALSEGLPGLKKWIAETQHRQPALYAFVLDVSGRDILQRDLPDYLKRRWREFAKSEGNPGYRKRGPWPAGDAMRSTTQINGPDGATYTLLFGFRRELSMLGAPKVQFTLLAIALVVSGAVCWLLTRSVAHPVMRLQAGARTLAAGNLNVRVGDEFSKRQDELGVLARDFDQMAERLRLLVASKEVLLRDISHELRTPLARLRLALGLARREGADLAREHERIEREAERLDELIGEVLRLSHLTTAQPSLNYERFDLSQLVTDIVDDARIEAAAHGKSLNWNSSGAVQIDADVELLRRGIENVLRNAVRFTAEGTSVDLALKQEADTIVLTISDHGPGVPEQELPRLFEPFYRVAQARERDSGGYGLGLAITAQVFALHGGAVAARNGAAGGLVVVLTIPTKPLPASQSKARSDV